MNKKRILSLSLCALMLTGCSGHNTSVSNGDSTLMTVGDTSYTKNDVYTLLKNTSGTSDGITHIQSIIYNKEVGKTKAMKEEAEKQYEEYKSASDSFESQIKAQGYTKKTYINKVLLPTIQADKLLDKYFQDNKKAIKKKYKPSMAIIIECDSEKKAKQALAELKKGTTQKDVISKYQSSDSNFSDSATLITTKTSGVPTRLVKTLYNQSNTGLVDEVFTSDDDSSNIAYVAILQTNSYDKLVSKLKDSLSSDSDLSSACMQYYLKKYNFEVHDQDIFDYLRSNNPEYLVNHPELAKSSNSSSNS
ncbi:hypothetical protein [Absicoccus intestinalis]|uniref:Foldase protein PrsA n=1 Tax=Absicoccus intestinalis TaxID=2926319 RepID=A0ABU4WQ83_9FIRM|nr:hypothetical protein [Absicoccus sp. CLA-KB-P134]MDX8418211.1 hypothetical protein [Absicoccus sp. CLA-KB-P134]